MLSTTFLSFSNWACALFRTKEQSECLNQIKKLSWILLGTLSHLGLQQGECSNLWCPIPFNKSPDIAKIVQAVLSGFVSMGSAKVSCIIFYDFEI